MSVERFDPRDAGRAVDAEAVARLRQAAEQLDADDFGLSAAEVSDLARLARHPEADWEAPLASLDSDTLLALVRLYTLAEALPGWEAGAKSPVIPMAAELRRRGDYPEALTAWIKSNTDNRFLPYGSLLDRL